MNFLIAVCITLLVIILIIHLVRIMNETTHVSSFDDEVEVTTTTTTTTTTTQPTVDQLPPLTRQFKPNGQPFVVDPVDGDEWMLNTNDDMYEDGAGKWYRLVDAPKV